MTQPVAETNEWDRLAGSSPGSEPRADVWTEVHEHVQAQLARLESEVRRRVPGVRVDKGRTKGGRFYLFSYLTFSMPGSGLDPVVTGITFTPADEAVTIEADVGGEQSGDPIYSSPTKSVPNSRNEFLAAAADSAREQCQCADAIAAALKDESRRVE